MEKKNYLIIALAVLLVSGLIIAGAYAYRQSGNRTEIEKGADLSGEQKDEHGCLIAAGYSWCEAKEKCLLIQEEACAVAPEPTESDINAIQQVFIEKYQKSEGEVQIAIEKFDGNYARGGVKFATLGQFGEGGIFLAYKENGAWKLAFDGNGMISCLEMANYNFPADMTLGCYDENTEEALPSAQLPNPASVNCTDRGGELEIRTGEDGGQYGVCKFGDGSECEEWALLRGECGQEQ